MEGSEITSAVYELFSSQQRYNHLTTKGLLPPNGIYIFYEVGEKCLVAGKEVDRIVRIGTHKSDGRFPGRIRQHYGRVNSLGGNKNASVFRKHLGGSLMNRANPEDPRIKEWIKQDGRTFFDVEEWVSRELRGRFTFSCFPVDTKEDRLSLESSLIALLAQHPLGKPSEKWLGYSAISPDIKASGLWNTQHIHSTPLNEKQFGYIKDLVRKS